MSERRLGHPTLRGLCRFSLPSTSKCCAWASHEFSNQKFIQGSWRYLEKNRAVFTVSTCVVLHVFFPYTFRFYQRGKKHHKEFVRRGKEVLHLFSKEIHMNDSWMECKYNVVPCCSFLFGLFCIFSILCFCPYKQKYSTRNWHLRAR